MKVGPSESPWAAPARLHAPRLRGVQGGLPGRHRDGYQQGFEAGFEQGAKEGYARGFPEGLASCPGPHNR